MKFFSKLPSLYNVFLKMCSLLGKYETLWKELDHVKQKLLTKNDLKLEEVRIVVLFARECYA
jgi:F-type H+-transporting ATPase subunit g